jgi:hypothetical protein
MRDYGVVPTDFWVNPKHYSLSINARLIAVYLMSCPRKMMWKKAILPELFICIDLFLEKELVRSALQELIDSKHLKAELKRGLLFIDPTMFREGTNHSFLVNRFD